MPELPRGTVTFLFTDIEGSTALWERDRAAMASAVARHLALLDAAIAVHGGVHFKTVGDAVQAAFPAAPNAVAAALAAQQSLCAEDWGAVRELRVRMALHAGEAEPDQRGDYLSAPLNRLSRLLATGHGGQILLSQTVQQLTRGSLPPDSELRDLGEHRLRDLLDPERVYQLLHSALPTDFPPLRSLDARPHNLPRQPTPFLGREHQVDEIADLLRRADTQLLTLVGPGGTGKTRLALQAAAEVLDDFADGVFFVPLAPVSDPALLPSAIATALGLREEGEHSVAGRVQDFLMTRDVLLVLDNFEHLVDGGPALWSLLGSAPRVKVLATSRVPLHLRAEREYPVPPLSLPRRKPPPTAEQLSQFEAVRLFISRAQAVKPGFTVDNENAPAVAEICWRLDGLPLAIELAAARVRMLPPQAMLARLEQRLPFLTGGARDAPARQQTLRNTIAWSYDLLDPEDQALFRRLAVFAGGCTLEAVETVGNLDGARDAFAGVERLCEQSLLRQEEALGSEPRFTMLETIREFGLERLAESGEQTAIRDAHAAVFRVLGEDCERAFAERRAQWFRQLIAEADNLRGALAWVDQRRDHETGLALATALAYLAFQRGGYAEARRWLSRFLAADGPPSPLRATALLAVAGAAASLGDFSDALAAANASEEIARAAGSDLDVGSAWYVQAAVHHDLGEWDEATGRLQQALACGRRHIPTQGAVAALLAADSLNALGTIAAVHGDHETAAQHYEEALRTAEAGGVERTFPCMMMLNLAGTEYERGHHARAAELLAEAFPLMWEAGDLWLVASGLQLTAWLASAAGRHIEAVRLLGAEQGVMHQLGMVETPRAVAERERLITTLRTALEATAFTAAWQSGRSVPVDEAVREARTLLAELAPASDQSGLLLPVDETS